MPLGLLIVAFHRVWSGPGLVVTLVGCALTMKGFVYFLWPQVATVGLGHITEENGWRFQIGGAIGVLLGLVIGWIALTGHPA